MLVDRELLVGLFDKQPMSVDRLPHSIEEIELQRGYNTHAGSQYPFLSLREMYLYLLNLRKRGELKPRVRGVKKKDNRS